LEIMDDLFNCGKAVINAEKEDKVVIARQRRDSKKRSDKGLPSILTLRKVLIDYTAQQTQALQEIARFMTDNNRSQYILAGFAGTGKTTIVENIINYAKALEKTCIVSAPTNQAVKVLREKLGDGAPAEFRTLHSVLYGAPDPDSGEWITNVRFTSNDFLVVDEGSMISASVYRDLIDRLQGTGAKVVFSGDSFQLEPVGEDPQIIKKGDIELTEVKRQAENSKILVLATALRNVRKAIIPNQSLDDVLVLSPVQAEQAFLQAVAAAEDCVYIVGTNRSRLALNLKARTARFGVGVTDAPRSGDSLIVIGNGTFFVNGDRLLLSQVDIISEEMVELRDNTANGVYKQKAYIIEDEWRKIVVLPEVQKPSVYHSQFLTPEKFFPAEWYDRNVKSRRNELSKDVAVATYGYCLTAHKSQGSQWMQVFVRQDAFRDNARWLYTAVTRAAGQLILTSDTGHRMTWESIENSAKL